ncbi:MAG: hypothetical protein QOI27_814 [Gaiellaceae bacterium]|jgi:hypothetical protein|nr:hypothetical protein [Gaiellaceae bacterium]
MRRGVVALIVLAVLALVPVSQAGASSGAAFGIQDDAWLMYGPGTLSQRLATLDNIGTRLVRFTLRWDQVAPSRPANARDPADTAYKWGQFEVVLRALHADGIDTVVTLYGAPRWANGGHTPNWLPSSGFANFAYAASKRFPWVHQWTVWNEPNGRTFSVPVSPRLYVTRLLNPAYASLHQASSANLVAGGVTSPRKTPSGMSPLDFMLGMKAAGAHLDAYAHNPYPVSAQETPFHSTCAHCSAMTMANLPAIRADVTRAFGASTPLWLTEYGYQTNPPDRLLGVSYATQARYIGEAALRVWEQAGVTMLIQFLVRDEPSLGGWQSGLFTSGGSAKPAYRAFALPLAEVSRRGGSVALWGQVRPGTGGRDYVLQRFVRGTWTPLGATAHTDAAGVFSRTATLPPGALVRIWSPGAGYASPALTIT